MILYYLAQIFPIEFMKWISHTICLNAFLIHIKFAVCDIGLYHMLIENIPFSALCDI